MKPLRPARTLLFLSLLLLPGCLVVTCGSATSPPQQENASTPSDTGTIRTDW